MTPILGEGTFTFSTTLFNDFADGLFSTFVLKTTYNCCTTTEKEIAPEDIEDGELVVTAEYAGFTEWNDGVYKFVLEGTLESNGLKSTDTGCYFLDEGIKCDVAEYVAKNKDTDVHIKHYLINQAIECQCVFEDGTSVCDYVCVLLKDIMREINAEFDECTSVASNCTSC